MRNKKLFKNKNISGQTLIELVIALGLFALVMIMVTESFNKILGSERSALASKYIQENMRNVLDTMSREMRSATAQTSTLSCCSLATPPAQFAVFCTSSVPTYTFAYLNSSGQCVQYSLASNGAVKSLQVMRGPAYGGGTTEFLTSNKINIKTFWVNVTTTNTSTQLATVFFEAQAAGNNTDNQDTMVEMSIKAR